MLQTTLLFLLTHPTAYARLQAEIDGATTGALIRDAEARALPYLQAVVRESLRLFPPASEVPFFKRVPAGGDVYGGVRLPGGTQVATGNSMWACGRERAFWGDDADRFRPERWLEEGDEERLAKMVRRVELAFGSGQFVCLGRMLGLVEVNKALAEVSVLL